MKNHTSVFKLFVKVIKAVLSNLLTEIFYQKGSDPAATDRVSRVCMQLSSVTLHLHLFVFTFLSNVYRFFPKSFSAFSLHRMNALRIPCTLKLPSI